MMGKPRLKITVEGLRKMARRLPRAMDKIALSWLYCLLIVYNRGVKSAWQS